MKILGYIIGRLVLNYRVGFAAGMDRNTSLGTVLEKPKNRIEKYVLDILRADPEGNYVKAIKEYRNLSGALLQDAKKYVDDLRVKHGLEE